VTTQLSVLDLVPITSGSDAAGALRNTVDLARHAEASGYVRYWLAEHHLNPGVAGTSTPIVIQLVAGATDTIRVGSGAVQLGHQTPLAVVEQFGLIDALHPGRIDLGLGRSGFRRKPAPDSTTTAPRPFTGRGRDVAERTERGLLLPASVSLAKLLKSPRFTMISGLLQQPGAETPDYAEQVDQILALLAGTYRTADGTEGHVVPGEGADVEVWVFGSSGGASAEVAGARGLRFAANYHLSPGSVLEAVNAYREAFQPSATLAEPKVVVSADVVVGPDDATAHELASGYGAWVLSIRTGKGAIEFPSPHEAASHEWTDEERALVKDRIDTQIVGSPAMAADQLEVLAEETGADEIVVTTITHDHHDRVRSYELLAEEWARRAVSAQAKTRSHA
jgi:alkanesulfonate monooxygenase SsuD/methylene tetrahydromethanopterin reductase-like flavin-dependent oxidoreductase (luciferase family)